MYIALTSPGAGAKEIGCRFRTVTWPTSAQLIALQLVRYQKDVSHFFKRTQGFEELPVTCNAVSRALYYY